MKINLLPVVSEIVNAPITDKVRFTVSSLNFQNTLRNKIYRLTTSPPYPDASNCKEQNVDNISVV